jgi:hypothetical protein
MEKFISSIQLSGKQASLVIDKYYPEHLDYNCPLEERSPSNPDFVKSDLYILQRNNLLNILTAPVGSVFIVDVQYGGGIVRKVGYTTIKSEKGHGHITGFRDETCNHIEIAQCFIRARSFGWFKQKFPL